MQKNISFKQSKTKGLFFDLPEKFYTDPISFTKDSKVFFEREYNGLKKELLEAINHRAEAIHVKPQNKRFDRVSTPYNGRVQYNEVKDIIWHMFGIIGVINTFPYYYTDETDSIIRAVAPRYNSHNEKSSQSPYNDLDWHVDAAYRPIRTEGDLSPMPDYLVFGVVNKGHEDIPITYVALKDVLRQLNEQDLVVGLSSEFLVSSPDSFSKKIISKEVPVLFKSPDGEFYSRIAFQHTLPTTERAAQFLKKIKAITERKDIHRTINVEPGDIVILNNKTTLHKRDKFQPKWDGNDRYFIRVYSTQDLTKGILTDQTKQWVWI